MCHVSLVNSLPTKLQLSGQHVSTLESNLSQVLSALELYKKKIYSEFSEDIKRSAISNFLLAFILRS